jgi:ribosomal protein L23
MQTMESEIEAEVTARVREKMKQKEIERRVREAFGSPNVAINTLPPDLQEKVAHFRAIQTKLHDAYDIPALSRRNYSALDAAIRGNDTIAREILSSDTPLGAYHTLRKEHNAIVHSA